MNKTLVSVLIILLLGLGIYFVLSKAKTPEPQNNTSGIPAPQGKLNVVAVCEGALAYMSFSSGEEASKFVSDCIAGEHPEVIEKYIKDAGLDGASI